jgi:hypothetical protein
VKPSIERWLIRFFIAVPLLSLALGLLAWLQYGFDLPFFDDWRAYATGEIDSFKFDYLFRALNGTMAPVGVALDALAQRHLDGNSVAYQTLSMVVVLGGLLALQWRLLLAALGNRLHAAMCFVLTVLMLQPGSYWGRENMAYHQALPLVFILLSFVLINHETLRNRWRLPAVFALGVLAGFTYISGAFGALAAGTACVILAWLVPISPAQNRLRLGGVALGLAGLITAGIQYVRAVAPFVATGVDMGHSMALPIEANFWYFYLGKVARSLLLPTQEPELSLVLVLVLCAAAVFLVTKTVLRVSRQGHEGDLQLATVWVATAAMVFVYLLLIAAGRTNLREPHIQSATQVFAHGFSRFHFFWATLLWPWALAALLAWLRSSPAIHARWINRAVLPLMLLFAPFVFVQGAFDHQNQHKTESIYRRDEVACLMGRLQSGQAIFCREFNMPDMTPAYRYAAKINASFVRYFPLLPIPLGSDDPSPLYRWTRDGSATTLHNLVIGKDQSLVARDDPHFLIKTGLPGSMQACQLLDVRMSIQPTQADVVQLLYKVTGQPNFDEATSQKQDVLVQPQPQIISFRLESPNGFQDELRLDLVTQAQALKLQEIEVRCRLRADDAPFFVLRPGIDSVRLVNMTLISSQTLSFQAAADPTLVFATGRAREMARCATLTFSASLQVPTSQSAQVFFRRKGESDFSEAASVSQKILPSQQPAKISFRLHSRIGFEDEIRFDPVDNAPNFRLSDIQLVCSQYLEAVQPTRY